METERQMELSSDSEDEERKYFFDLQNFFEKDCASLLRTLLENIFPDYAKLLNEIPEGTYETDENPGGIISKKDKIFLSEENCISRKFKLDLLFKIFQTGVCDKHFGSLSVGWLDNDTSFQKPQNTSGVIYQILQIRSQFTLCKDKEEIPKTDFEDFCDILHRGAKCLSKDYPALGNKFIRRIEKTLGTKTYGNIWLYLILFLVCGCFFFLLFFKKLFEIFHPIFFIFQQSPLILTEFPLKFK